MSIRRYFNYSLVFYDREDFLKDIEQRANLGFSLTEHSQLLSTETQTLFRKLFDGNIDMQRELITKNEGIAYIRMLFDMISQANHDRILMTYVLPTIDGIIFDDRNNLKKIIQTLEDQPQEKNWLSVLNLIIISDDYDITVYESAARIRSQILAELDKKNYYQKQKDFLLQLINISEKRQISNNARLDDFCFITCLSLLLKHEHLVRVFLENKGAKLIYDIMKKHSSDLQKMYYTLLVLWLISFSEKSVECFIDPSLQLIKMSIDVIQKISREKLIRIAFQCYKNLASFSQQCIELMVDKDLLKVCETLLKGNIKEKELVNDIQQLGEVLEKNIRILTSFEKYVKELNLQNLEWNPVHTEKFWKENVKKFDDNDYQLIKKLVALLNSDVSKNVAIACYDIGEFCRFHPFGRNVIEKLGGKNLIMIKARHEDQSVRENALLALQKIMLHNWQIAGK